MIVAETYKTLKSGVVLIRTYSDAGKLIERDGVRYAEAVDPEDAGRVYTETDEDIPQDTEPEAAKKPDMDTMRKEVIKHEWRNS
jgi:hypothetical protein